MTATLDLSPIGNCAATALIDQRGRYVWACCPRVDGEPVFSALLTPAAGEDAGVWSVDIEDEATIEQAYIRNTPILRTVMRDRHGNALEVIDFAPRMHHLNRTFRPWAFYRIIRPPERLTARQDSADSDRELGPRSRHGHVRLQSHPV